MPIPWQLWLVLLATANMVAPLFFIAQLEARVVLGVFLANFMLMTVLTAFFGFTRILGLGHLLWLPLLYFLGIRLGQIPADDWFGRWIRVAMVLNSLSLAIDAIDVIRYFNGDREETVPGL